MNRRHFLKSLIIIPIILQALNPLRAVQWARHRYQAWQERRKNRAIGLRMRKVLDDMQRVHPLKHHVAKVYHFDFINGKGRDV